MNQSKPHTRIPQDVIPQQLRTAPPFSDLFPVKMATLGAITESMEQGGFDQAEPIVVWDDLVIDGHTRLGAALAAGIPRVPVVYHDFEDEDEAIQYAIKRQRDRRNLTDNDLLRCLDVLDKRKDRSNNFNADPKAPHGALDEPGGKSADTTAELLGTSTRKVERARAVLDHASDDVKAQVLAGEKSINSAYNETKATPPRAPRPKPADTGEVEELRQRVADQVEKLKVQADEIKELASLLESTEEENKAMGRVLDAEDKVKAALAEVRRFKEMARIYEERNNGLMNQNHALAADCKRWMNKFMRLEKATKGQVPTPPVAEDYPFDDDAA